MKSLAKRFVLAAALAALAPVSHAAPQLRLFDGTTTITLADNGPGDLQDAAGQTIFVGALGSWILNVHVGTTHPVIGTLQNPVLDLSFNAVSNGSGTLWISFSADGFGPTSNSGATASIGGTVAPGGSLTYATYGGTNNTLFSTSNPLSSQGPFGPGAFSGSTAGQIVNNNGPYSLTQVIQITHGPGSAQTTGDALIVVVPDGGNALLLLGAALLAGAIFSRSRFRLTLVPSISRR